MERRKLAKQAQLAGYGEKRRYRVWREEEIQGMERRGDTGYGEKRRCRYGEKRRYRVWREEEIQGMERREASQASRVCREE